MIKEFVSKHENLLKIARRIKRGLLSVYKFFPLQEIALFESNPDFNDEGYWLCDKFIEKNLDRSVRLYWLIKNRDISNPPGWDIKRIYLFPENLKEWFEKYYVLYTAKYIFDSCLYIPKLRKKQFRLFLFHGMPIKRVDQVPREMGEYDYYSAGSRFFADYYKSIGVSQEKLLCLGLTRNDRLQVSTGELRRIFSITSEKKIIMWMPTYRQHSVSHTACELEPDFENETGMPVLYRQDDFRQVNGALKMNNMVMIIKTHQSQDLSVIDVDENDAILWLTSDMLQKGNVQLYDILADTDALITDYSSVYVDYLLLKKPIGLTIDDLNKYSEKVGLVFDDYKKYMKGFYINTKDDFVEFINKIHNNPEELMADLSIALDMFHDVKDFTSGDRFISFIKCKTDIS